MAKPYLFMKHFFDGRPAVATAAALAVFFFVPVCRAQNVITTIAGSPKILPDGAIPPSSAPLVPVSVVVAQNSDVYFIEQASHSVLRLTRGGDLSVVAGTGIEGYSGDGGQARSAALAYPAGLALDTAGNLYIADSGNHRIRRVISDGTIQTVVGTGTQGWAGDGGSAASARIQFPAGLAFDTAGNLFIADRGNFRIRRVDRAGVITTYAGNGGRSSTGDGGQATNAGFGFPEFIAIDSSGNLFISDAAAYRVRKIVPSGVITTVAGTGQFGYSGDGGPGTSAAMTIPQGVSVDAAGNVFFADWLAHRIRRITPAGRIDSVAGNGEAIFAGDGGLATAASLSAAVGVAVDPSGGFVIADSENARVRRVNAQGLIVTAAGSGQASAPKDGGLATDAGISLPAGIAVSNTGVIYVADRGNKRVRRIGADGRISTAAGTGDSGYSGDGGQGSAARINSPAGVAVDAAGNLYVADRANHRVRRVDTRGIITTFAGSASGGYSGDGGPASSATLAFPTGVTVDASGRVLIADSGNNVIRRVDTSGVISTVAGSGTAGFGGDGGPALRAQLNNPSGVVVDGAGDIIIADSSNRRVRRVGQNGNISTIAGTGADGLSVDGSPAASAALAAPIGVAVDGAGNVFIADRQDCRIRKVSPAGVITTVAGTGFSGFVGDGGLATQARLHFPEGVALDQGGNVYFTDRDNNRVRVVLANPPTFTALPGSLSFSATASGTPTSALAVAVLPVISGSQTLNAVGLPVRAVARDSWLKVSGSEGTLPHTLLVSVDPASLTAGQHQTSLLISSPATSATRELPVVVDVAALVEPRMALNTNVIGVSVTQGARPVSKEIVVKNTGSGQLPFSTKVAGDTAARWLKIVSGEGSATPKTPATISLIVDPGGLAPGTYSAVLQVEARGGQREEVPVNLSVTAAENLIVLSQSGLNFLAVAGGGAPLPQSLSLLNSGSGALRWAAEVNTLSGGNWLSISSTNGTLPRGSTDPATLDLAASSATLGPGKYYGQIVFRSNDAQNSPQSVSVVLEVLPPGTSLAPEIRPSGLIFAGTRSNPPGAQSIFIANLGATRFSYASNAYTADGAPWLAHLPINDTVEPGAPARVRVQADFRGLEPGIYTGVLSFQNVADGSIRTVNIVSVVAGAEADVPKASRAAGACVPNSIKLVPTATQKIISATVGQAIPIEVQIVDSCGDAVLPTAPGINVDLSLSNRDQGGTLAHSGGGKWTKTYQPKAGLTGRVTATITALASGAGGRLIGDQVDISIDIANRTPPPIVRAGGVLNGASLESNKPVAPGSLVTLLGDQLATSGPGRIGSGVPLPTSLNGTEVRLAGRPLPLFYAESGQINAQLPFDLPPDTEHQLIVYGNQALSLPESITVASAKPAIFTVSQNGIGQGSITNAVTGSIADSANPVREGDIVSIYCTGLGTVNPAVPEGIRPPTQPLSTTTNPVTVSIGGAPAQVLFAGLAPGITGLYQVNVIVPRGSARGSSVLVTVSSTGQVSAPVTIAVQ